MSEKCVKESFKIDDPFNFINKLWLAPNMAKSELKLIGKWSSPYSIRVEIPLNIKSLNMNTLKKP